MIRCWYCRNADDPGCDCGQPLAMYHEGWCVRFGCHVCGDRGWLFPWQRWFWEPLEQAVGKVVFWIRTLGEETP